MAKTRAFNPSDAEEISRIANEAFGDEISRGMPLFTAEGFMKNAERANVKMFVVGDGDEPLGFLTLSESDISPTQIHVIAVKRACRGRGLGKELVRAALDHVRAAGREKVRLFTRPWNVAMRKVCDDTGFVPEAYLRKEYLGEDLIQYSLFLEKEAKNDP